MRTHTAGALRHACRGDIRAHRVPHFVCGGYTGAVLSDPASAGPVVTVVKVLSAHFDWDARASRVGGEPSARRCL